MGVEAMRCVVGVDLGGTNVRAQALWEDGSPAGERYENPSYAQLGTSRILDALALTIEQAVRSGEERTGRTAEVAGIAIPGHVDDTAGVVRWAPNFGEIVDGVFRYWEDVPIKRPLADRVDIPVVTGNDANVAALGEYRFGLGRNEAKCLVMFTLGTGIGGGVVLGPGSVMGRADGPLLLLGGNQGGVELGHTLVQYWGQDCNAGSYGAIEAYCQRDAIIRRAQNKIRRGRRSLITDLVEGDLGKVTPMTISRAAEEGDGLAREVWHEFGAFLGAAMGSMINVFAPDVVAVGGQVSKAAEWFMPTARIEAENVAIPSLWRDCRMDIAQHIDDAGVFGAAALALSGVSGAD